MTRRLSSAPGKLVIAGEYAVLEGYPGIVTAVNKRVYVTGTPSSTWEIQTTPQNLQLELVHFIFQTAKEQKALSYPKILHINSSELYQHHSGKTCKLGLGSSAAVTTSITAQLLDSSNFDAIFAFAFQAHKAFTHQTGSGIDIAASVYGGILSFQILPEQYFPQIKPLTLAISSDSLIPVFMGKAQDTRLFLQAVQSFKKRSLTDYQHIMKNLGEISLALQIPLCVKPDWHLLMTLIQDNFNLLQALGKKSQINLVTKQYQALASLAKQHGGAAKPSGAGGGDMALCFIPPDQKTLFIQKLAQINLYAPPLDFLASGVQIQSDLSY